MPERIKLKEKEFLIKKLLPCDIDSVLSMQGEVVNFLSDKSILQPSTYEEIVESVEKDCCFGVYCDGELAAFAIIVLNRKCDRNLGVDWENREDEKTIRNYVTFDTVQVHPSYRGYGIQRYLLSLADAAAEQAGAEYLIATVSPDNPYSLRNFEGMGYYPHPEKNPYEKYKSSRVLVRKDIRR